MNPPHRRLATPRTILIVGGNGMLGRAWCELAQRENLSYQAPPRMELDLLNPATINHWVTDRFDAVVNCAAWTDVDAAETHADAADQLNGQAVGFLTRRCAEVGIGLVHYSTDYVFNGTSQPIPTGQKREPQNAYGRSKAIGEEFLEKSDVPHLLVRTSWLYAPWGKNFVRTIAALAQQKPTLRVVNDQRGRPTSAEHLAAATLQLMRRGAGGTFHVTDGGVCTWFDLATQVVRLCGANCRVEPCTTAEFPRPAKRPAYSVLDLSATENLLGPMPHWHDNLASVVRRMVSSVPVRTP